MVNLNSLPLRRPADAPLSPGAVLYGLAASLLIAALLGLGAIHMLKGYFSGLATSAVAPGLAAIHQVVIGAQRYAMPAGIMVDPAQRRDGFAERVDLSLALPLGPDGRLSDVDITLMPRGRVRTSAALLDSVYLHQFSEEQLSGVPGLVGKPLDFDAGTRGETVWYDPLSANPFVAKCMTPVEMRPDERTCLRVMSLADRNSAIVSFAPSALAEWRAFDRVIEDALATLRL
ncbi:hypothetical protein [Pelagibacterium lacus]|uniref:Transmembrane protein n=1 Tax=Pelagibacterium lacus TaxID=2282655 RepID=A0A369WAJ1_9HYPH|nr:hypothetical protein [Pelagibacterium lacus]RDE10322.1 hypothetical protein DVH29_02750 [Pelagibacterium lacus]